MLSDDSTRSQGVIAFPLKNWLCVIIVKKYLVAEITWPYTCKEKNHTSHQYCANKQKLHRHNNAEH